MDVVIPFNNSINDDLELMFTLRSFDKYFAGLGRAIVVGDKPAWDFSKNLIWIDYPNPCKEPHYKARNILNKILRGLESVEGVEAIVADDDMFQLSPCD